MAQAFGATTTPVDGREEEDHVPVLPTAPRAGKGSTQLASGGRAEDAVGHRVFRGLMRLPGAKGGGITTGGEKEEASQL
jgi:hypothetical protein